MAADGQPKRRPTGDYPVGFAKPPETGQFKPGRSGNPKGRRKPALSIDELVEAELNQMTAVKLGGEVVKLSKREALAKRIVSEALQGDRHAQKLALALAGQAAARREGRVGDALSDEEVRQLMVMLKYAEPGDAEP